MVWVFSAGLWLLLAFALARCFLGLGDTPAHARQAAVGLLILLVVAAPLYFRPHEEILGGEDPGAYLNAAVTFGRTGQLTHVDPLLSQVPEANRPAFLYGHSMFGQTKDACLWIKDLHAAEIGPWFQPAYPVMLSLPLKLLPAWCVLYGAPLMALLAALALAAVGTQLYGRRRVGMLAILFFLLNPVVLWNGRSPRAEWGAVLFFWLGLALLARAWRSPGERRIVDFSVGAACLLVAPFFHITAWFGVIPMVLVLLIKTVLGRRLFILIIPVLAAGALGFLMQLACVTDCYSVLPNLKLLLKHSYAVATVAVLLLLALVALCGRLASTAGPAQPMTDRKPGWFAWGLWLLLPLAGIAVWWGRDAMGHLPFLPAKTVYWFSLTNLRGLALLVSRFALLATVAGWGVWLFRPGAHADLRVGLAAVLLPGLFLTGWMDNYMMESRRMLLFPVPVMALCLAALVMWLWDRRGVWGQPTAVMAGVVLLYAIWHGRTHLAKQVDCAGLYRALEKIATPVQKAKGWLLAEYSQTAAPMEHMFGIPTLAIDSDYHAEYSPLAEQAWRRIMMANPTQPCFFLTPFQPPHSEFFTFKLERRLAYRGKTLVRELGQLPRRIAPYELTLSLYRMSLRLASATQREAQQFPHVWLPDAGNMGLRGFANLRIEAWPVRGFALPAKTGVNIPLDGDTPLLTADGLYFIFHGPFIPGRAPPRVDGNFAGIREVRWIHLTDDWWVLRLRGAMRFERNFHIHSPQDAVLADVQILRGGVQQSLAVGWPAEEMTSKPLPPVRARWTQPHASFVLPAPRDTGGELFLYVAAPAAVGATMPLQVAGRGMTNMPPVQVATDEPHWVVVRTADIGFTPENPVVMLNTDKPWRCGIRGFPSELGVLLVYAVAIE